MAATTPKPGPYDVGPLLVVSGLAWGAIDEQYVHYFSGGSFYTAPVRAGARDVETNDAHDLTPADNYSDTGFTYPSSNNPTILGITVDMGPTTLPRYYEYTNAIDWFGLGNRFVRGYWSGAPTEHVTNNLAYFQTPPISDPNSGGQYRVEVFSDLDPRYFDADAGTFDTPVTQYAAFIVANIGTGYRALDIQPIGDVTVAADAPATLARLRSARQGLPGDDFAISPIYKIWPAVSGVSISYARRNGDGPAAFSVTTAGLPAGTYPITVRVANGLNSSWSEDSFTVTAQ